MSPTQTPDTPGADTPVGALDPSVKLALVGPVWPYRGGIAQYTTCLKRALEDAGAAPLTVSFRKQYPAWLYPGGDQIEPGGRGQQEAGTHYLLCPWSPLSWIKGVRKVRQAGCTHAVLDWWTLFWAPAMAFMAWRLRRAGVAVVLLCHNMNDHGQKGPKAMLARMLAGCADGYVVHSSQQARALGATWPGKPVLHRIHPTYDRFPAPVPAGRDAPARKARLEALFFGFIRPYKGLDVLLEAMALTDDRIGLTVAGEAWGQTPELDRAKARLGERLDLRLGYLDDAQAAAAFQAADVVVLPYREATGSGVAAAAIHYRKPIVASDVGGLKDVVAHGRTGWLVPPGDASALARVLGAMTPEKLATMQGDIERLARENSWEAMARALLGFVRRFPGPGGRAAPGEGA